MALSNESLGGGDHLTHHVDITSRNLTIEWVESVVGIELTSPGSVSSVLTTFFFRYLQPSPSGNHETELERFNQIQVDVDEHEEEVRRLL